ncbi:MAG TPA: glycosyltransferase family 1 protein [Gemmatimonadaceae bacterium]|nr:glycosyltransferase family 1 protein [Gemmatimonadaceae bacterium]
MIASALRVAIDLEHTRQSRAGIARYTAGLLSATRDIADIDLIGVGGGPLEKRGTLRKRLTTLRQDFWWYPYAGRNTAKSLGARVYHSPLPRGPIAKGDMPTVITVHDLVPLHFPETTTPWSRLYSTLTFERILDAASIVLAPSQDTARDIRQSLGISAERIRVVPNGVDEFFFSAPGEAPPIPRPFILFVGTPEPRKNLGRLAEAVTALRSRGRSETLVVAGCDGWGGIQLDSSSVTMLGRVSDATLRSLYAHAACLAIPSLHEGFGLPAIEAMATGTPVVASDRGALREVTGGDAVLVDPLDPEAIASGIVTAIEDRDRLSTRGRERARLFSWSRAAGLLAAVYRELS